MTDDPRHDAGMRVRREVLGDAHVDRASGHAAPFAREFQAYITRAAWGEAWTSEVLDRRTRSAVTLALLAAGGHENELAMHVRVATEIGLTPEEIAEVLKHTAVYAGVPAGNAAMGVAQRVLLELGLIEPPPGEPR